MVANLDLQRVIQAARSGQKLEARKLMAAIVKTNPKHAQAWFILSFLVDDQTQQIDCLQRTLKYAPDHIKAQERLQQIKANSVWQEPSNSSNSDSVPLLTLSHKENTSANRSLPQTNAKVPHSKKLLGRTDNK